MKHPVIEVYETIKEDTLEVYDYRWRLMSANREIVASGEGYTRMADAERGAREMVKSATIVAANLAEFRAVRGTGQLPDDPIQVAETERV